MKSRIYALLLGGIILISENKAIAISTLPALPSSPSATIKGPDPLSLITAQQFLSLSPKKYQEFSGKKMNLVQRIEFRIIQQKVKKMVRKGEVVTMADVKKKFEDLNAMNLLGFMLGLVLGPVGVVIALILKETGDVGPEVVRWSLYGLLLWLAIVLVIVIL